MKVDSSNYGNYSSIIEQIFNMKNNLDQFNVLRKVKGESKTNQRKLAKELNFSLGKLNYCLKALKVKGLIKINSFKNNPSKIIYVVTPKGISWRTRLTLNFMKKKMREYDELKAEFENNKNQTSN